MKRAILFVFILFQVSVIFCSVQKTNLDSLYAIWLDESKSDSLRTAAYKDYISIGFLYSNPDTAFVLAEELVAFGQEKQNPITEAIGYTIQGAVFGLKSNYPKALECHQRSLKIYEEVGYHAGMGWCLSNIGLVYNKQSNYPKALEYLEQSIKIAEEIGDTNELADPLNNIGNVYQNQSNYPKALENYQRSLKICEEVGSKQGIANALGNIGNIYKLEGNYPKALEFYQRSLLIKEEIEFKQGIGKSLINIGTIYHAQSNYLKALEYGHSSLKINEELGDKNGIAVAANFIGGVYNAQSNYAKALEYNERSLKINEEIGNKNGIANALIYIAGIYFGQSNYPNASEYLQRSIKIYEELDDKSNLSNSLTNGGLIFNKIGKHQDAIIQCQKSLEISKEIGSVEFQKRSCSCLYDAYKELKNWQKALEYFELEQLLTDSLKTDETNNDLQRFEFDRKILRDSIAREKEKREIEVAHQKEITEKNKIQYTAIGGAALVMLLAIGLFARLRYTNKTKKIIEKEKNRSEELLLNILPAEVAEELKNTGASEAKHFEEVSILFTDFKDFTQASELLSAKDLVNEINTCFKAFDHICEKYGIEKIKTIGDSYMCAAGLGQSGENKVASSESASKLVLAALEMQEFINARSLQLEASGSRSFQMRAGIHTGPVVAGIVGVKKFQYDIWGDTVNTASRMESHGEVGKVNISEATYEILLNEPEFSFEAREEIEIKGKGKMQTWFVNRSVTN